MTKDDLKALIEADRAARQDLLRDLIEADRKTQQGALLDPTASPEEIAARARWQSLVTICRLVHETLDNDDEEADELLDSICPEPLEAVRKRLINLRRMLRAAAHDQDTITNLRLEAAKLREERDEAQRRADERLADLQRIQASDDVDDRHWRDMPPELMTTGQILAMRQDLEDQVQKLIDERFDRMLK